MPSYGITLSGAMADRFWAKVDKSGDCWLWTSFKNWGGYGRFKVAGRNLVAHILAYETLVSPVPDGLVLDHYVCDNRGCVNPAHLKSVTPRRNTMRGNSFAAVYARQTTCPKGHPYSGTNNLGRRICAECRRAQAREARQRYRDRAT